MEYGIATVIGFEDPLAHRALRPAAVACMPTNTF